MPDLLPLRSFTELFDTFLDTSASSFTNSPTTS